MTVGQRIEAAGAPALTTTILVVAVLASLTFLTWDGRVNGDAYVSLASAIIGGVLVRSGISGGAAAANADATRRD